MAEGGGIVEFVGDDSFLRPTYICSNCFDEEARASDYYPKCGAKMDGESNEEVK